VASLRNAAIRRPLANWGGLALRTLALVLVVLALANPRWPDLKTRIHTEGIAIVLLVDVSSSMGTPDFDWKGEPATRLEAVRRVFRLFVEGGEADGVHFEGRPTDLLGMITFASRYENVIPLTLSHSVLLNQMERERPQVDPTRSWTNLSDAVVMGVDRVKDARPARRVLVLLTDGVHNVNPPPSGWKPRQAAQIAASLDIPIYVIDAGSENVVGVEAEGTSDESATNAAARRAEAVHVMQQLAGISRGEYFRAADTASLLAACQSIDRLERTDIESFQYRRYYDSYPWLGCSAFGLLLLAWGLEMTIWRRLP
jgi:Ca-activated chloride channel family protein